MTGLAKRLAVASILAVLGALTVGSATASAAVIPNCVPKTNIEGIIDDSGSMSSNDPSNYRADLMEAIAFFNPDKTMGSVYFGTDAFPLFGPFLAGPNFPAIQGALNLISGGSGGTDYDAAFMAANGHNSTANARVFLSDGEPNFPPNSNLWKVPKIPAYVVGFGTADFTILNQIAVETGGPSPFSIITASQLRNVGQIINARINCEEDPILVDRQFNRSGQQRTISFTADGSEAQVLLSWPDVGNVFKTLFGRGGKASAAKKKKKSKGPRVTSTRGASYIALNLSNTKGKVKFKVKAKKLLGSQTVTAAIIP